MPHYKDGTEAKVGDHVVGQPYNTRHKVAGTIISITPGVDSCNCQVSFIQAVKANELAQMYSLSYHGGDGVVIRMARTDNGKPIHRVYKGEDHGSKGDEYALVECVDYGGVNDFELVARPIK